MSFKGITTRYAYDQGANGLGRLTTILDQSGSTAYSYDAHGNVVTKTPGMDCNQDGQVNNQDKSCIARQIGNSKNHGQGKGAYFTACRSPL